MLGSITDAPRGTQPDNCTWDSLFEGLPPVRPAGVGEQTQFKLGESVISRSHDVCSRGSWVFYNTHNIRSVATFPLHTHQFLQIECPSKAARVFKVITSKVDPATSFVVLERWNVSEQRDKCYGMPTLHRNHDDTYFFVSPEVRFPTVRFFRTHGRKTGHLLHFQCTTRLPGWGMSTG